MSEEKHKHHYSFDRYVYEWEGKGLKRRQVRYAVYKCTCGDWYKIAA